ncbi:MAG: hypothetical protein KAW12_16070 [Candidatus Aminicenantes bacterium]|nr:hypothetical protein [Candidatus Aminicenantes bacterium]
MQKVKKKTPTVHSRSTAEFQALSQQVIDESNRDLPWADYLSKISQTLIQFSGCDAIEMQVKVKDRKNTCEVTKRTKRSFSFAIVPCALNLDKIKSPGREAVPGADRPDLPLLSEENNAWTGNMRSALTVECPDEKMSSYYCCKKMNKSYQSIAFIPIRVGKHRIGVLQLLSRRKNFFPKNEYELYENFALTLGPVLLNQRSQAALRERVKELTCLYGIARAVEKHETDLKDILKQTVALIPPAWQYPQITHCRIILDGESYTTPGFKTGPHKQTAGIVVKGVERGVIAVVYTEKKHKLDEGPFLDEERHLLNTIAGELALIIERKHSESEEINLQAQLRHADRLATIGQLASGVAHEINEPLCNILGFAQLTKKDNQLPEQSRQDIEKIINASLHAREIVRKLLIFGRQMPTKKVRANLNLIVKEGIYFLESRCTKEGIELLRSLAADLPEVVVDQAQMTQVLVNLVVNAIQAMPDGGRLNIQTQTGENHITLIVEDTGTGMNTEVLKQIFLPFFTTKDVGEGTGLGLSVVHGIVSSHGGSIKVDSKAGAGTKFEIHLPIPGSAKPIAAEVELNGKIQRK